MIKLNIIQGDITKIETDAIVNAANNSLLGGEGVDGAIHRAAGQQLMEECKGLKGCSTGDAKVTLGYLLPARYVIHTVGPIWRDGKYNEDALLASCYKNCLKIAVEKGIKTIAFPSISTGVYNFPLKRAARIAVLETTNFLDDNDSLDKIIIVCYDEETYESYLEAVQQLTSSI